MNIVVVGGGTAGWLAALSAKHAKPESTVTLVESDAVGILGAGEGSTSHFVHVLAGLGISVADVLRECNATIKNGVKFSNWNERRAYYYPFPSYAAIGEQSYFWPFGGGLRTSLSPIMAAKNGHDIPDFDFIYKMSEAGQVPFFEKGFTEVTDFIPGWNTVAAFGLHFDARELAVFLRKIGEDRGIIRVEGFISEIVEDADGYVSVLRLADTGREIETDFVFDCSGFARLIVGKHYGAEWKSHASHLPVNRALPFFLARDEAIPAYTESVAMNCGWMWKIPLQHRTGCGYVFDSNLLSDEEAKAEVIELLGYEVDFPTVFSFEAGCFKTPWVKNVIALGLSSGFIEPLEATSIWQTSKLIQRFFGDPSHMTTRCDASIDAFNRTFVAETDMIVSFLYLHYVTRKTGTPFWADFTKNNAMPDLVASCLSVAQDRPLYNELDFTLQLAFGEYDYTVILTGNDIVNLETRARFDIVNSDLQNDAYLSMLENQENLLPMLASHDRLILGCKV